MEICCRSKNCMMIYLYENPGKGGVMIDFKLFEEYLEKRKQKKVFIRQLCSHCCFELKKNNQL